MSVDWHGTTCAQTYSLLMHVDGRPEYVDDRWSSNCFATLLELMMTISWPSSRQYTTGPIDDTWELNVGKGAIVKLAHHISFATHCR